MGSRSFWLKRLIDDWEIALPTGKVNDEALFCDWAGGFKLLIPQKRTFPGLWHCVMARLLPADAQF